MGIFSGLFSKRSGGFDRSGVASSASNFLQVMGWDRLFSGNGGAPVTTETALGVPAVWDAVNFLSGTLARLPMGVYQRGKDGDRGKAVNGAQSDMLREAVNDEMTSFGWRQYVLGQVFTEGRGLTYIERDSAGRPINLFPMDVTRATVRRDESGRSFYKFAESKSIKEYPAADVLDFRFMSKSDGIGVRSPIAQCRDAISQAIEVGQYAGKLFQKGGLPPMTLEGPFQSGEAARRAAGEIAEAMTDAAAEGRPVLALPSGHELKSPAFSAEDMQMLAFRQFMVREIARIYQLPPVFLQDLEFGTFANTEQQDLMLVKHTLMTWIVQIEQECTLKLLGRRSRRVVGFNADRILRGDFKTRMEGNARAIQTGQLTPNEARKAEGLPEHADGDRLMIQGATVPLATAGQSPAPAADPAE